MVCACVNMYGSMDVWMYLLPFPMCLESAHEVEKQKRTKEWLVYVMHVGSLEICCV